MQVYLVRTVEGHEIQGIFWAPNLDVLWDTYDEIADPYDCEYAPIGDRGRGGALLTNAPYGEGQVYPQFDDIDEDGVDFDWGRFDASEHFWADLTGQKQLRWTRFDASDVGHGLVARVFAEKRARERKAASVTSADGDNPYDGIVA